MSNNEELNKKDGHRKSVGGRGPMSVNLDKAKDSKGTIKRLLSYLKGSKKELIIVYFFILLFVVLSLAQSVILQPIIDDYIVPLLKNPEIVEYKIGCLRMISVLIIIAISTAICSYIQSKIMIEVSQNTVKTLRDEVFVKLEKLPIKYFDTHPNGELMSRIVNDIDNISISLNTSINQMISGLLTLIATLAIMIIISPVLSVISLLSLPIMLIVVRKIAQINKSQFIKGQEALAKVDGFIEEYVSGQKVIKAFNKEDDVQNNFNNRNQNLRKNGFMAQTVAGIVMPIMGNIGNITTAITTVVAGIFCIRGKISLGTIAIFSKFSREYSRPIIEITNQFNVIQSSIAGAERIFEILDETEEYPGNKQKPKIEKIKGHVQLKDVYFEYEDNKPVLKDINIEAKPGETIALVGPTGAGKTTTINLLTRFYDVTNGEILIDGKNIKEVEKDSLRNSLGIVLQDTVLFSGSVKDNIRYGKLDATDEEIINAAKLADAHSFIKRLPNGYDTIISEDAGNISKGQAQLINIARVILNDPQILVLDEATSNVDTRMEVKIQNAMNKLLEGRTSFVIAHRLSTIVNSDKILVINNGEIVEQGNHNELIAKKGIYFRMYTGVFEENF
ncbi:MAG: ABC transporter ATP-binding protein [Clostridia bacterium]|nr:ABC transporter ATP-binding protein [Clostridia bacterium]